MLTTVLAYSGDNVGPLNGNNELVTLRSLSGDNLVSLDGYHANAMTVSFAKLGVFRHISGPMHNKGLSNISTGLQCVCFETAYFVYFVNNTRHALLHITKLCSIIHHKNWLSGS